MKKSRLLLVAVMIFVLSFAVSCGTNHTHEYGDWSIVTNPTITETGLARRMCSCGKVDNKEIPALSDTSVWTLEKTEPTHHENGADTYKSEYGNVVIEIPAIPHEFGAWKITVAPTADAEGKATRECECGEKEEYTLPTLANDVFWTVKEKVDADHENEGHITYTSEYGEFTVTLDKVPHTFGEWTLTTAPDLTNTGKATRKCSCGKVEEVVVPALTDAEVWQVKAEVAPDHNNAGSRTYVSIYGEATIVLDKVPHTFGEWTLTTNPDMNTKGEATRECTCGAKETTEVPALSDSAWKVTEDVKPGYYEEGHKTYHHDTFGDVVVAVEKLPLPFMNKVYSFVTMYSQYEHISYASDFAQVTFDTMVGNECVAFVAPDPSKEVVDEYTGSHNGVPYEGFHVLTFDADGALHYQHYEVKINKKEVPDPYDPYGWPTFAGEYVKDSAGNYLRGEKKVDVVVAYDNATGAMTYTKGVGINFMFPVAGLTKNDVNGVKVGSDLIFDYAQTDGSLSGMYVNDKVYFEVTFEDLAGNVVTGADFATLNNIKVFSKAGEVIASYVKVDGEFTPADGKEGTYTETENTLELNGAGTATLNGVDGTYNILADGTIGLYVDGAYYDVTLNSADKTYTSVKTMVTVKFETAGKAVVADMTYNKNIAVTLPVPENAEFTFRGWFTDEACENAVADPYVPTENTVLVAKWTAKVTINLVGVIEGDETVLKLGEGDVISEHLPVYTIDKKAGKKFVGWFIDDAFNAPVPGSAVVSTADDNTSLYAKWEDLPAYYGTYNGKNVRYTDSTYGPALTFSIDENGNIKGQYAKNGKDPASGNYKALAYDFTGVVAGYDPETQIITWKADKDATETNVIYFDSTSEVIVYNNIITEVNLGETSDGYNVFSKVETNGANVTSYGVKVAETPGATYRDYFARFVNITTKTGTSIFVLHNKLYADYEITDALGNALTVATIKDSKTLVVKANGEKLVAITATGDKIGNGNSTKDLDKYVGSYNTADAKTVLLDGAGVVNYDGKTGTYTLVSDQDSTFDVYLNNNTEYYRLTLSGADCTMDKVMVTITFDNGGKGEIAPATVNANVEYQVETPVAEGFKFLGWYSDAQFTTPVASNFAPAESMTIYAKWAKVVVVTLVYNNGAQNESFEFGEGETITLADPAKDGSAFGGWYTTATFDAGSEFANGTKAAQDVTVYAKWNVAAPYANKTYGDYNIYLRNENKKDILNHSSDVISLDENGHGWCDGNTLKGVIEVSTLDSVAGKVEVAVFGYQTEVISVDDIYNPDPWAEQIKKTVIKYDENGNMLKDPSKPVKRYVGYVDAETGVIMFVVSSNADPSSYTQYNMVMMTPNGKDSVQLKTSFWNNDSMAMTYDNKGTPFNVYFNAGTFHFNATFKNHSGADVAAVDCYNATDLVIADKDGNTLYEVGSAPVLPSLANKTYSKGYLINVSFAAKTSTNVDVSVKFDADGNGFAAPNTKIESGNTVRNYDYIPGEEWDSFDLLYNPVEGFIEELAFDENGNLVCKIYDFATTPIDAKECGWGASYKTDKFEMNGENFVKGTTSKTAYVDPETGIIVCEKYNSSKYLVVMLPDGLTGECTVNLTAKNNGTITVGTRTITLTDGVATFA